MRDTYRKLSLAPARPSPWATWEQQATALDAVLSLVSQICAKGYRAVVEIDLDLTSLLAAEKAATVVTELAPRASAVSDHLTELPASARAALSRALGTLWQDPKSSSICLPGYTDGAIEGYGLYLAVLLPSQLGLKLTPEAEAQMAEWIRSTVHGTLRNGYWDRDLSRDQHSPGLVSFLTDLYRRGGEGVFVSNRPLATHQVSISRLTAAVAAAATDLTGDPKSIPLFAYFGPGGSAFDASSKQAAQEHLEQSPPPGIYLGQVSAGVVSYGNVSAPHREVVVTSVFDDRAENRRQIVDGARKSARLLHELLGAEILSVAIATVGHSAEFAVTDSAFVTASFERKLPSPQ